MSRDFVLFINEIQKPKTVPDTKQTLKNLFNEMNKEMAIELLLYSMNNWNVSSSAPNHGRVNCHAEKA